jgi:hypothetical protein
MPAVASGIIILWSGTNASIPSGWTRETSLDGRYPAAPPPAPIRGAPAGR